MKNTIDNTADILDSRDVIARIEELQDDDNRNEQSAAARGLDPCQRD